MSAAKTPDNTIIEHKLARVFKILAEEQKKEGKPYGVIEFGYADIVDRSDIKYESTISAYMMQLRNRDVVEQIQKGNYYQKSIWNVTKLLEKLDMAMHEQEHDPQEEPTAVAEPVEIAPEERPEPASLSELSGQYVQESLEAADEGEEKEDKPFAEAKEEPESGAAPEEIEELNQSLKDMIEHIQSLPNQMIGYLERFQNKIKVEDTDKVQELEDQVIGLMEDKEELENKDAESQARIAALEDANRRLRNEAEKANTEEVDVKEIARLTANLHTELDKFLNAPSWQYKGKANHFRKLFEGIMDRILEEVGANELADV